MISLLMMSLIALGKLNRQAMLQMLRVERLLLPPPLRFHPTLGLSLAVERLVQNSNIGPWRHQNFRIWRQKFYGLPPKMYTSAIAATSPCSGPCQVDRTTLR
jgi:hypothetical protein